MRDKIQGMVSKQEVIRLGREMEEMRMNNYELKSQMKRMGA